MPLTPEDMDLVRMLLQSVIDRHGARVVTFRMKVTEAELQDILRAKAQPAAAMLDAILALYSKSLAAA